ncbi:RNA polymerase factor sigma-54 [Ignavigranum ruoffiae]
MEKAHANQWDVLKLSREEPLTLSAPLPKSKSFSQLLRLNIEQMHHYLEEAILENPFVEMEYHLDQFAQSLSKPNKTEQDMSELTDDEREELPPTPLDELQKTDPNYHIDTQSLETYLFEQIMMYRQTSIRDLMVQFVELLDERGYLPYSAEELADKLQTDPIVALDALTLFKLLEPAGIGAFNLQEALMLQTERDDVAPAVAYYLLENYFEALINHHYDFIQEDSNFTESEIQEAIEYYQTLTYYPADIFEKVEQVHIIPDVKVDDEKPKDLTIRYQRQFAPRIYFNREYFEEMSQRQDAELTQYLKEQVKDFNDLARQIRLREELFMKMVYHLVRNQEEFFSGASSQIKPLTLRELSQVSEIPESYLSHLIVHKHLSFKQEIFVLTDFINLNRRRSRTGFTAYEIKQKILQIIAEQDPEVSNTELVDLLADRGFIISPKIVANYRKLMH